MSTQTTLLSSLFVAISLELLHCGGGPAGQSPGTLIAQCSGSYTCTGDGETVQTTLSEQSGACYAGQVLLAPDGTADANGDAYTWHGDAAEFFLCDSSSDCLDCTEPGVSSGSSGSSGGSSPPTLCSPCWAQWACLAGDPASSTTLVYFDGTQNADGSCTLTQTPSGKPVVTAETLECGGQTDQSSPWTYSTVPGAPQLGLCVQFVEAGQVYGSDGSIVSGQAMYCDQT
jgi:hypothetical protein